MSILRRLLSDETAVTYVEYLIVTLFLATVMVGFGRVVTRALSSYLNRIFLIVTLPIP